ncbi:MAG: hypothetical protein HC890_11770 [Chloroflexaceae bacterium]|nr:hypothetical protein [Chloroflexaceae bacterium]
MQTFLAQWQHPLAQWLRQGEAAASAIDRIAQLRNRAAHADTLYLWQFKELWGLIVGSDRPGILQSIYGGS